MILRKRYRRDFKHHFSLYISATFLTVLSLLLFYLYDICGTGILDYADTVFERQSVEDANFNTYKEIPQKDLEAYEEKYNLTLEKQRYINIETDGVTARVFEGTKDIDLYYITEGRDVKADDEIVISEGYAQNAGIHVGDTVRIRNQEYEVTGYVERPDYLYMLQNPGDADKNISSFYICYMTDDAFSALGNSLCQYLVRYNEDNNQVFRKDVNAQYALRSYTAAEDNLRITMMTEQPKIFLAMAYFSLLTMPLMAVVLISIILSRKIRNEQKLIGTLSAYGYSKGQLCRYYAGFAAIPGIVGGVLTTVLVAIFAQPYGELGLMDYEPLRVHFQLQAGEMLLGILLPTLMYVLSTIYTVHKLLKNETAVLLAGAAKGRGKIRKSLVTKKISLRKKICVRSILGNPGRTCVLFFGIFLGSFVVFGALGCLDTIHHISTVTAQNMGNYNYQYVLSELNDKNPYGGETMLAASMEDENETKLTLYGADDNTLVGLRDEAGQPIVVDQEYVVTSLYAYLNDIKKGDEITLRNPLTTEKYKVRVAGIAENDYAKAIYTSRSNVSQLSGIAPEYYNVILSKDKLTIPEEKIITTLNRDTIDEQYEAAIGQMNTILYLLAGIGMILCMIAVYIAVNMTITENRKHISMLHILGYERKQIRKLMLRDNILIVIPAIGLSLPVVLLAISSLFASFADILGYIIEVYVEPSTYLISIGITLLGYYVSMGLVNRKLARIDMVECLKDNRE